MIFCVCVSCLCRVPTPSLWSVRPLTMEHVSYVLFNIFMKCIPFLCVICCWVKRIDDFIIAIFACAQSNRIFSLQSSIIALFASCNTLSLPSHEMSVRKMRERKGQFNAMRVWIFVILFFPNFFLNWSVASTAIYTQLDAITLHCAAAVACCISKNDKIESHKQMSLPNARARSPPNGKTRMSSRAWIFSIQRQKCTSRVFEFGVNVNVIVSVIVVAFDCVNCAVNFMESLATSYVNASHIHTSAMWRRRRRRQRDAFEWMAVVVH